MLIVVQICVTLYEWEHIAERFEKATHYLEKALYKVLTQHIVPAITAELKVPCLLFALDVNSLRLLTFAGGRTQAAS